MQDKNEADSSKQGCCLSAEIIVLLTKCRVAARDKINKNDANTNFYHTIV